MISFKQGSQKFNYRIAGITIHQNRVLLHRLEQDAFWALPGGRGEIGESSPETLKREYLEEIGATVSVGKTLFLVENFFQTKSMGEEVHELSLMFEVLFPEDSSFLKQDEFIGQEEDVNLIFKWFPLEELENTTIYPAFLNEKLLQLPTGLEHVIHRAS